MLKKIGSVMSVGVLVSLMCISTVSALDAKNDIRNTLSKYKSVDVLSEDQLKQATVIKEIGQNLIEITPKNPQQFASQAGYTKPSKEAVLDKVYLYSANQQSTILENKYNISKGTRPHIGKVIATTSQTCYSTRCSKIGVEINQMVFQKSDFSINESVYHAMVPARFINITGTYEKINVPENGTIYLQAYAISQIIDDGIWKTNLFSNRYFHSVTTRQPVNEVKFVSWKTW